MSKRTPQLLVQDILDSCRKILDYTLGMSYEDFVKDSFALVSVCLIVSCSTTPNNNGGSTKDVPFTPTNLVGNPVSTNQINLTWTDNATNEVGYKVQRKTGTANYSDVASTGADIATYSDFGLTTNTTYIYRVYAYNSEGNSPAYSNEITITTIAAVDNLPSFTSNCGQTWTTQNLSVSRYRNGDVIPQITDATQWQNLTTGAWCWYNNDSVNYSQYGKLYNWYAVDDPRGLALQGWHIPTDAEWNNLVKCIDPYADTAISGPQSITAGGAMKEVGTIHWHYPNTGANNNSGFAGLPGGSRNYDGTFYSIGYSGVWWGSTAYNTTGAWFRSLLYNLADIGRNPTNKTSGFSVRLVRD